MCEFSFYFIRQEHNSKVFFSKTGFAKVKDLDTGKAKKTGKGKFFEFF